MHLSRYGLAVVAISLTLSLPARADLFETQSISISGGPISNGFLPLPLTLDTSLFNAFNPALGTLVSISASLAGTLNYTGGGIPADEGANLALEPQGFVPGVGYYGNFADIFVPALGNGLPFSFTASDITDPVALSLYKGTGLVDLVVYDAGGNFTDRITMGGQGTVTYDYTAASTPEPSSVVLALTVVAIVGLLSRRKLLMSGLSKRTPNPTAQT